MSSDHPNERRATYVKVELAEEDATLREKLIEILDGEVCSVTINLRDGRVIDIGPDPIRNPDNKPVKVWIGRDYIKLDNNPAAPVQVLDIVPFSMIVSVTY